MSFLLSRDKANCMIYRRVKCSPLRRCASVPWYLTLKLIISQRTRLLSRSLILSYCLYMGLEPKTGATQQFIKRCYSTRLQYANRARVAPGFSGCWNFGKRRSRHTTSWNLPPGRRIWLIASSQPKNPRASFGHHRCKEQHETMSSVVLIFLPCLLT